LNTKQAQALGSLIAYDKNIGLRIIDFEGSLHELEVEIILESAFVSSSIEIINIRNCKGLSLKACNIIGDGIIRGHTLRILDISQNEISNQSL
jgi:hypothetical protein